MPEMVTVSTVESSQNMINAIEEYFKKGRYLEIMQVIGMHSILIDPQHSIEDQKRLYRTVLSMIKKRIAGNLGQKYSSWYTEFPGIMDEIITGGRIIAGKTTAQVLESHTAAFGRFKSVDDFFFWALNDRRLTLDDIVQFLEKTAETHLKQA